MAEVWFYQLGEAGLDRVLPELLEKALARKWRAVVRTTSRERVEHLDGWLWTWRDDSFLPHGIDEQPEASRQPVLLITGEGNPNGAQALFLIDGAEPGDLEGYERCVILFDGSDEAALAQARARWSALKRAGTQVSYWRQNERGGWDKQG